MANLNRPWLEAPSEENNWKWRCHGIGMVFQDTDEQRARQKLEWMRVASGGGINRPLDQALPQ